ncbi:YraN family protein [Nocardioides sp.]|uniref:YraN family protein n=1 Tax=Nocardioides sp. TaxID=35761 RepID=UPI001A335F63|nr:YraN family protein [Nocardioides sp.]MBJ7356712.1 YraN family protein [Nocardioides sp.]
MTTAAQRVALGAYGERVAAAHLAEQGMVVLERNWRCDRGELDLVLRDGEVLVACEVKTRATPVGGSPHEAVDTRKLQRLHDLLWHWCEERGVRPTETRVDLVGIVRNRRGPAQVDHVRGLA